MLSNKKNGTLYVGVTNNLIRRTFEHKDQLIDGFTKNYGVHFFVYYEIYRDIELAILREKELKHWNRNWKIRLIEKTNPEWTDLYTTILE